MNLFNIFKWHWENPAVVEVLLVLILIMLFAIAGLLTIHFIKLWKMAYHRAVKATERRLGGERKI